ncbi:MAG: CDP-alcohol phosphatidyltransferase family protein [Clostridiales bacterium]|nr:CDP-alcohol phosphatidyltransferase family protein [Candidatus Apopatocola equi]
MANLITCLRILCGIGLLACAPFSSPFYCLYLLGGVSDVLDGFAARHFGTETRLGAQLDTAADIVFTAAVLIKVLPTVPLPLGLILWTVSIAVIKGINVISGFVMYKRFVAEHTVMNKLCGILLYAIPLCIGILPPRPVAVLISVTCAAAAFAAVQEGHYIRTGKEIR